MNFLHLVPRHTFDTKMARERFAWMDHVNIQMQPYGHGVHTTGPGWHDWDDSQSAKLNVDRLVEERKPWKETMPHFIIAYQIEGLLGTTIPIAVVIQEAYNRPKTLRTIRDAGARLVVFTYHNELAQYEAELEAEGRHCITIPHSADDRVFKDYGLEKTIDILIVGNMNKQIYPHRVRLARLAWRDLRKRGYRVEWLQHPGYKIPPPNPDALVGEMYARKINQSRLVVTCTSRFKYALSKLAEIPLCRTLPVSDVPAERQKFFEQTMLVAEAWRTDREIQQSIEDVLDNPEDLERRTKVARDKIESRLVMKYWAERFIYYARRFTGEVDMAAPMAPVSDEDL